MGLVHPQRILTKGGARPSDVLYLTKRLGTGIITTAAMQDLAEPRHLQSAIESMLRLNRHPSHIVRQVGCHALTDITGFGLLGHGQEMAEGSGVALRIEAGRVPLFDGALTYAAQGICTGGESRNRAFFQPKVRLAEGIADEMASVLSIPDLGRAVIAASPEQGRELEREFAAAHESLWRIGDVVEGEGS
jgi:selenide,water dikinase